MQFTLTRLQLMKDERDKDNCFQCTHCSDVFSAILSASYPSHDLKFLDASFSKISTSHSMISTALFYKWDNEHIKIILVFASRGSLQFILHILWDFKPFQANVLMPFLIQIQNYKTPFSFLEPSQWIIILPCHFLSWCFLKSTVWTGLG